MNTGQQGRSCNNSEIDTLNYKRLSLENKKKLSQLKIVNKQYGRGGVLSFQLREFRFVLYILSLWNSCLNFAIVTKSALVSWESFALFSTENRFEINVESFALLSTENRFGINVLISLLLQNLLLLPKDNLFQIRFKETHLSTQTL